MQIHVLPSVKVLTPVTLNADWLASSPAVAIDAGKSEGGFNSVDSLQRR
jgi:hypothetical protein